jgi:hypothetical protein
MTACASDATAIKKPDINKAARKPFPVSALLFIHPLLRMAFA